MKTSLTIQEILHIDSDQYNQIVFDRALEYLTKILDGDAWAFEHLVKAKTFWEWWKRQWVCREFAFIQLHQLDKISHDADVQEIVTGLWAELHSIDALNIRPNNIVMEATFAEMMGELIGGDEKKKGGAQ